LIYVIFRKLLIVCPVSLYEFVYIGFIL